MTTQQQFGRLVRRYRERRNLSFLQCAKIAGVSKGLLLKIESGKGNPCLTTIEKLARVLKVAFEISGRKPPHTPQGTDPVPDSDSSTG